MKFQIKTSKKLTISAGGHLENTLCNGKRDDKYTLFNELDIDEGFVEIVPNKEDRERIAIELKENHGKYKRGKGSQKQMAVLVMAESKTHRSTSTSQIHSNQCRDNVERFLRTKTLTCCRLAFYKHSK